MTKVEDLCFRSGWATPSLWRLSGYLTMQGPAWVTVQGPAAWADGLLYPQPAHTCLREAS